MNMTLNPENTFHVKIVYSLFLSSLLLWWSGFLGADLYAAPALLLIIYLFYLVHKHTFYQTITAAIEKWYHWSTSPNGMKFYLILFVVQGLFWVAYPILKYYSFNLFTLDAGHHSNILYNISNGEFYSSVFNMNSLGEHFTLSMSFISIFYKIIPSINWMMGFKILAYLSSVGFIWLLCREYIEDQQKAIFFSLVLSLGWLFFYRPIVNSVRYEFQANCLAPPFIFYAFYCLKKNKIFVFFIMMVILLGFKEHLGVVWIGFGIWAVLQNPQKKMGYILVVGGIIAIYLLIFEIKPFLRESSIRYNDVNLIDPFNDLGLKAKYFFGYLLLPILYIPLLYWKNGIMAGPAIGINLITGQQTMYSSHYHYDDAASALLFIAVIISLEKLDFKKISSRLESSKLLQCLLVIWLMFFLILLPYSPLRFIKKVIPQPFHQEIIQEINNFDQSSSGKQIAVQDVLGSHFYRKEMQAFYPGGDCTTGNKFYSGSLPHGLPEYDFLVLAPRVHHWGIPDMEQCISELDLDPNHIKLEGYQHLVVYQKKSDLSL